MSNRENVVKRLAWLKYRVEYAGETRETAPEFSDAERDALARMIATQYRHPMMTCQTGRDCQGAPVRAWGGLTGGHPLCSVCRQAALLSMYAERTLSKG